MAKNKKQENYDFALLDYYQRPFYLMHQNIKQSQEALVSPHPIRNRFWKLIPDDIYDKAKARELLNSYLVSVESELSRYIKQYSLAYCLHLYRRLSPGPIGRDRQPATIGLTRAVLEAAFQKYARFSLCEKIAESESIPINEVLGGLLINEEFEIERNIIAQGNQLVLTNFTSIDLQHKYELESLAYEIWRTAAALRTIGKGAPLVVCGPPDSFHDERSDDLDFLVINYDQRQSSLSHTATGVEFSNLNDLESTGGVLLPLYNLGKVTAKDYEKLLLSMFKIKFPSEFTFNFVWFPFNLRNYRNTHLPFAAPFKEKYGISLDAVLAVIAAILIRILLIWSNFGISAFTKFHQRAYEGPINYELLIDEINHCIPHACVLLKIEESSISSNDVLSAFKFWELNETKRDDIGLSYSGPHNLFLPIQSNKYIIDYAWIHRRLYDLFLGVQIPDQNFKGDALEKAVKKHPSVLPINSCKASNGEERQVDYAFSVGKYLIIAECKVVWKSIGFDRGDPDSIKHRTDNVVELSISQADEKASWLALNPVGTNYDISPYDYILPVGVSPFVEFIPSRDTRYWISDTIPRVLTVKEFHDLADDKSSITNAYNKVKITKRS